MTVDEAFSGFSIIDDGWFNLDTGDYYEATFSPAIVNGAGEDFVVFDARFDTGLYVVSTSYDGFSTSLPVWGWIDSGEIRSYWYDGGGPWTAAVWGAPFDLTDLGVPTGVPVSTVRVTAAAADTSCDALGIGALGEVPDLADLAVTKTSDAMGTLYPGDQLTYSISATNNGPTDATGVVVTDTFPALVTYVSDACSGTYDGGTATWTWMIGALANGASVSCGVVVEVVPGASGPIDNTVNVTGDQIDPHSANNSSTASAAASSQVPGIPAVGLTGASLLVLLITAGALVILRRQLG